MPARDRDEHPDLTALASLAPGTRRDVYFLALARDGITADQAGEALGVARSTAAHHLERLLEDGLVEAEFRRLTGRTGPGAGRPAKIYRPADRELDVTLPPRQYRLAAELLARAVAGAGSQAATDALVDSARAAGRDIGAAARARRAGDPDPRRQAAALLRERGVAPDELEDGTLLLRNCPFERLVAGHEEVVCEMHRALTEGILDGLGAAGLRAERSARSDACCVALRPA